MAWLPTSHVRDLGSLAKFCPAILSGFERIYPALSNSNHVVASSIFGHTIHIQQPPLSNRSTCIASTHNHRLDMCCHSAVTTHSRINPSHPPHCTMQLPPLLTQSIPRFPSQVQPIKSHLIITPHHHTNGRTYHTFPPHTTKSTATSAVSFTPTTHTTQHLLRQLSTHTTSLPIPPSLLNLISSDNPTHLPSQASAVHFPDTIFTHLEHHLTSALPTLPPHHLINLIWAICYFSHYSPPLYTACLETLYNTLHALPPADLVFAVAALSQPSSPYLPSPHHHPAAPPSNPLTYPQKPSTSLRDLATSSARTTPSPDPPPAPPQDLAALTHELLAATTEFIHSIRDSLSPSHIVSVLGSYAAVLHYEDDEDFFNALADEAAGQLPAFTPAELSSLLSSYAALQHYPEGLLGAAVERVAADVGSFPAAQLAKVLRALVHLGHPLPDLWKAADKEIVKGLRGQGGGNWGAADVVDVIWALSVGHEVVGRGLVMDARKALTALAVEGLEAGQQADLFDAYLKVQDESNGSQVLLPGSWMAPCFTSWEFRRLHPPPSATPAAYPTWRFREQPSLRSREALTAEVATALRALGCIVAQPELSRDGLFTISVPLRLAGTRVLFEPLLQPDCCRNPPHRPTGLATSRMQSLARRGWVVVPVHWHVWGELESGEARAHWLRHQLQEAAPDWHL